MPASERYAFGRFSLDVTGRRLAAESGARPLAPKAFDVLVALVRQAGALVTKQDLLDRVWADISVEEGILAVHVSALRKTLGDPASIETVPRFGYRFALPVQRVDAAPPPTGAPRATEVLELVGRGRVHVQSASMFELSKANDAFQAALAIDPTYAEAHAGLALSWCAHAELRALPRDEAYARAKAAALRALAMDDRCADAQVALAAVLFVSEWDWAGARRSVERALAIEPHHTEACLLYGRILEAAGEFERGLAVKQTALAREPFSPSVVLSIAVAFWNQRRYDESIEWAHKALELDDRLLAAREHLAGAYWKQCDFERMLEENLKHAEAYGAATGTLAAIRSMCDEMVHAFRDGGRPAVVRLARRQLTDNTNPAVAVQRAVLAAEAGDLDEAFEHLDRAIAHRDPCLVNLAVAPQWDALRADPRFDDRLRRIGLPALASPPESQSGTGDFALRSNLVARIGSQPIDDS